MTNQKKVHYDKLNPIAEIVTPPSVKVVRYHAVSCHLVRSRAVSGDVGQCRSGQPCGHSSPAKPLNERIYCYRFARFKKVS